jgi:hypothetical protein
MPLEEKLAAAWNNDDANTANKQTALQRMPLNHHHLLDKIFSSGSPKVLQSSRRDLLLSPLLAVLPLAPSDATASRRSYAAL